MSHVLRSVCTGQNRHTVIKPYTGLVIADKAATLAEKMPEGSQPPPLKRKEAAKDILDDCIEEMDFVETMAFARELTKMYDVGTEYPSEQRVQALLDYTDWREAAVSGLFHLIDRAIEIEIQDNRLGLGIFSDNTTVFGSRSNIPSRSQSHSPIVHGYPRTAIRIDEEQHIHTAEELKIAIQEAVADQNPPEVNAVQNLEFIAQATIIDYLTETSDFNSYDCMSDTAVRDVFGGKPFCEVIPAMVSEFAAFYR
jgi:hypothetical protein